MFENVRIVLYILVYLFFSFLLPIPSLYFGRWCCHRRGSFLSVLLTLFWFFFCSKKKLKTRCFCLVSCFPPSTFLLSFFFVWLIIKQPTNNMEENKNKRENPSWWCDKFFGFDYYYFFFILSVVLKCFFFFLPLDESEAISSFWCTPGGPVTRSLLFRSTPPSSEIGFSFSFFPPVLVFALSMCVLLVFAHSSLACSFFVFVALLLFLYPLADCRLQIRVISSFLFFCNYSYSSFVARKKRIRYYFFGFFFFYIYLCHFKQSFQTGFLNRIEKSV